MSVKSFETILSPFLKSGSTIISNAFSSLGKDGLIAKALSAAGFDDLVESFSQIRAAGEQMTSRLVLPEGVSMRGGDTVGDVIASWFTPVLSTGDIQSFAENFWANLGDYQQVLRGDLTSSDLIKEAAEKGEVDSMFEKFFSCEDEVKNESKIAALVSLGEALKDCFAPLTNGGVFDENTED